MKTQPNPSSTKKPMALFVQRCTIALNIIVATLCLSEGTAEARNIEYLDTYFTQLAQGSNKHVAGLYGSRSLSVPNPEVYLQSDAFFLDAIRQLPGFQEAFFLSLKDYHPDNGYSPEHSFTEGPVFSYADVTLGNYQLIPAKEIYPDCYPFLPWFDRRMAPISVLLKSTKVNSIEKASLLYFQKKYIEGVTDDELFIVYCENELAYVSSNGTLYNTNNIKVQSINGEPVLIFNETNTWYPLFGRDDSVNSPGLTTLLADFAIDSCNTPSLTMDEQRFINKVSVLGSWNSLTTFQKDLILAASGSFSHNGLSRLNSVPHDGYSMNQQAGALYRFENRLLASTLSPIADYLGVLLKAGNSKDFEAEFHTHNTWGGELWEYGMPTYTIDMGWRLDVGTCRDLSMYTIAALELSGHEWVRLHGIHSTIRQHYYVVDLTDNNFIDNGYPFSRNGKMFMAYSPYSGINDDYTIIDQLTTQEGFATFSIASSSFSYYGTLGIESLKSTLSYLDDNSTIPLTVYGANGYWDVIKNDLQFTGYTETYVSAYQTNGDPTSCSFSTNFSTVGIEIGTCETEDTGNVSTVQPPVSQPSSYMAIGAVNFLLFSK